VNQTADKSLQHFSNYGRPRQP